MSCSSYNILSYRGQNGTQIRCGCGAVGAGAVWGTDLYTDDSSVCVAAVSLARFRGHPRCDGRSTGCPRPPCSWGGSPWRTRPSPGRAAPWRQQAAYTVPHCMNHRARPRRPPTRPGLLLRSEARRASHHRTASCSCPRRDNSWA
ncbi:MULTISPECIES: LCCL domain-containing protein [Corallococcus]|uniref:LCCL domain-containing protein n=1 Tax=Corallococcus TaxID=83461 RepID=UPI0034CD7CB0